MGKSEHDAVEALRQIEIILNLLKANPTISQRDLEILTLSLPRIKKYFIKTGIIRGFV